MGRSVTEYGPYLLYPSGAESGYRLYQRTGFTTGVRRPRPQNLLTSVTSYTAYLNELRSGYVYVPQTEKTWPINFLGFVSGNTSSYQDLIESARRQAATRLRSQLKDQTWNAAQTFAELGKTMTFFVEASQDLLHAYRLARKGDVFGLSELYHKRDRKGRRRRGFPERSANRWLQWRYAVMPTVYDMQDMLTEYFRSGVEPAVKRFRGSGQSSRGGLLGEGKTYGLPWFSSGGGNCRYSYTSYVTISPNQVSWKRLGLLNLPSLLWELAPGSFLVDVWCPIGTYLSGLDAEIGVTNVTTVGAYKLTVEEQFTVGGARQTAKSEEYSRVPGGIPSQPLPTLRTTDYAVKARVGDAVALLTQIFLPKVRDRLARTPQQVLF